jgi:hypothetical protein
MTFFIHLCILLRFIVSVTQRLNQNIRTMFDKIHVILAEI